MKLKRIDIFLIVFGVILIFLTILFAFKPDLGTIFSLSAWTGNNGQVFTLSSGLIAISIACFFGALVPFPVPYTIVVSIVAYQYWALHDVRILYLILMLIVATLTNLFGDIFDYIIGFGAGKMMDGKNKEADATLKSESQQADVKSKNKSEYDNKWAKLIYSRPKLIPFVVFLFGATPLPDSLLLMPLGVVKYSLQKTMLWSGTGKFVMMLICAVAGIIGFNWLLDLLGSGGGSWITGMVILYISFLIVVVMTKF